jgi:endonuclease III
MSAKKRADLITKLHRFVKKEYQVVSPPSNRSVLEHMLYGCCLENSTFDSADEAFAKLQENYFDWNEVRVTTMAELAEPCKSLSHPKEAASSLKKTLHGVFEYYYQFDLDFLKKENLSKAVQTFQKFNGVSPFVVSHVAQNGLGGHSIPLDRSMMSLFYVLGIVTEDEAIKRRVPGLERTIAKAKGTEFFVLTHQLAVAFASTPFSNAIRDKLLKISPSAKDRFPKRGGKKKAEPKKPAKPEAKKVAKKVAAKTKSVAKTKVTKKTTTKKAAAKPAKKSKKKKVAAKSTRKTSKRPAAKKKSPNKRLSKKKPR